MAKENNRTTIQLSITVNSKLAKIITVFLTPEGMMQKPKGADSQLIGELLMQWVSKVSGVNYFDLLEFFEANPDASKQEVLSAMSKLAESRKEALENPEYDFGDL